MTYIKKADVHGALSAEEAAINMPSGTSPPDFERNKLKGHHPNRRTKQGRRRGDVKMALKGRKGLGHLLAR